MYVLIQLLIVTFVYESHGAVTWRVEPNDIIAFTGETVTMSCIASGTNSSRSERQFQWYKLYDPRRLSKNHILLSSTPTDRISVEIDKPRKRYSLMIRNVTEEDTGQFQCILKDGNVPEIHSDVIVLNVIEPPIEGYTPCKHYNGSKMLLTPSGQATIRCESMLDDFKPNPSATRSAHSSWPDVDRTLSVLNLQNGTVLLKETEQSNKNSVQFCSTNIAALSAPESCTLLPDLPKLPVLISPSNKAIDYGDDLTFQCIMVQSWEIIEYRWYIEGALQPSSMFLANNSQSLSMKNIKGVIGEYKVICQVTDRWHLSINATAIVTMKNAPTVTTIEPIRVAKPSTSVASTTTFVSPSLIASKSPPNNVDESATTMDMQHISILVGPMMACIILFVFSIVVLWYHSKLKKERQNLKNQLKDQKSEDITNQAIKLRGRRYSDSVINRQSVLYETDYENVESVSRHRSLYIDQPSKNFMRGSHTMMPPVHANLKVKIEVPNLTAALSQSDPNLHAFEVIQNQDTVSSTITDTTFVKTETIIETENEAIIDISELAEEDIPPPLPAPRRPNSEIANRICDNQNKDHYYVNLGRQARLQRIPPIPPPRSCNGNIPCGLPFRRSNSEILHPGKITLPT
ncbi:uncharacterized protein [Antedon mediterranea]|uniref:uncharacterized protein n=1 Tax=Antedon mediterranea TaxID=105859 RepID=UPI003AF60E8D